MWPHFIHFVQSCIRSFTSSIGTNPLGFTLMVLDSIASIAVSLFRILRREGIDAMRRHLKLNAWITAQTVFWVTLILYGPFAIYGLATCVYKDHQDLVGRLAELQDYAKNKAIYDQRSKWAEAEVKHWQEAYQRAARGDTKPDRILSREDQDTLYNELVRLSKDAKNKDYAKLEITSVGCERESRGLAYQLFDVFKKAHWDVPMDPKFDKREMNALSANAVEGITIFSDDQGNKARFIQFTLRDVSLDSQIYPLPAPGLKGTIIMIGVK